ncbi:hypothetical protein AB6A40_010169 [Gnathostoma spinigerum]|uniref:Uncharacterized protein n=1 Tax=Gnathostoma spinigerum TaxID=75299 RepID=A0ABD6F2W2_9BILA
MEPTASRRLNIFNTKDEMNFLRHLWNGININNSWESFVIHAPHSLNALEKLMVYAVRTSTDSGTTLRVRSESSFSYGDPVSTSTPLGVIRDAQLHPVHFRLFLWNGEGSVQYFLPN